MRELTEVEISEAREFLEARLEKARPNLEFLRADSLAIGWFLTCWERDYWRNKYIQMKDSVN